MASGCLLRPNGELTVFPIDIAGFMEGSPIEAGIGNKGEGRRREEERDGE